MIGRFLLSTTMLRIIFALSFVGLFGIQSCSMSKHLSSKHTEFFEGVIHYEIEYVLLGELNIPEEEALLGMPNRSVLHYDNGNFIREYYHDDSLISTYLHVKNDSRTYAIIPNADTVLCTYHNKTYFTTDMLSYTEGDTILGYPTMRISALMRGKKGTMYEGFEMKQNYHNATELPVDPAQYELFTAAKYNESVKKYPGISLRNEMVSFGYSKFI